jgi:hypothetical protein
MTFSITKPRKIGHPIYSNTTFKPNKPYKIIDVSNEPVIPSIPSQTSRLYSYSVRTSMLGHLLPATGCTDCPNSK